MISFAAGPGLGSPGDSIATALSLVMDLSGSSFAVVMPAPNRPRFIQSLRRLVS